jgi:hypothetical protein
VEQVAQILRLLAPRASAMTGESLLDAPRVGQGMGSAREVITRTEGWARRRVAQVPGGELLPDADRPVDLGIEQPANRDAFRMAYLCIGFRTASRCYQTNRQQPTLHQHESNMVPLTTRCVLL